jgi:hypothetical protein
MDDTAINHDTSPDACANGQIDDVFLTASYTTPGLTFDIGSPVAHGGELAIDFFLEPGQKLKIFPAFDIWRPDEA